MSPRDDHGSLDDALAHTADGAFVIDAEGRIILWNRAAEKLLGYSAREVIGRPCCDIFMGRDDNGNRLCYRGCHVTSLVRLGDPVHSFDMQSRTKAGQHIWINVSTLISPDGHGGGLTTHLFRDVTETKELLRLVQERLAGPPAPADGAACLTRRELEVLRLMASGANTKVAAERLHVSRATVRNHVQNILGKLGVHSRLEAVSYATAHRLL
jgi:PAS domain S-box-containing protein